MFAFDSLAVAALVVVALVAVTALLVVAVVSWFGVEALRVLIEALPCVEQEEWSD